MFWAVVMAGGQGTRFWPESRKSHPKQFLKFFGKTTLLEDTLHRISSVIPPERTLIVVQKDKISLARRLGGKAVKIIGEPIGRNTAPCLVTAAAWIRRQDPEAVLAVLPADHLIAKAPVFRKALKAAGEASRLYRLPVTFGIKPHYPATGYGYLEMGPARGTVRGFGLSVLKQFHEKPPLKKAERFFKSGRFLWNSGMFVWHAGDVLDQAKKHLPEVASLASKIAGGKLQENMDGLFHRMPSISIDYGLMEKMKGRILAIPADFGWSDVGSWRAMAEMLASDSDGNTFLGPVVQAKSRGNLVKAGKKLIALVGTVNLVVVDTEDALLVCSKEASEDIKSITDQLKNQRLTRLL